MNDTLVVVHCYAGDQRQVETFLPQFLHHQTPVLLLSPEDAPVNVTRHRVECASAGKAGWKGPHTVYRQIEHWRLALARPAQWFLLNDADSMCITPDLPGYLYSDPGRLWCNVLCHEFEHKETDHPNLNPPYFMHRGVLQALLDRADELDDLAAIAPYGHHEPEAAIDGFYSYLVLDDLHIPYENFPDGATTWPRGMGDVIEQAHHRGARMIHGIKEPTHLAMVRLGYNTWEWEQRAAEPDDGPMFIGETVTI